MVILKFGEILLPSSGLTRRLFPKQRDLHFPAQGMPGWRSLYLFASAFAMGSTRDPWFSGHYWLSSLQAWEQLHFLKVIRMPPTSRSILATGGSPGPSPWFLLSAESCSEAVTRSQIPTPHSVLRILCLRCPSQITPQPAERPFQEKESLVAGILGRVQATRQGPLSGRERERGLHLLRLTEPDLARGPVKLAPRLCRCTGHWSDSPTLRISRGCRLRPGRPAVQTQGPSQPGQTWDVLCSRPGLRTHLESPSGTRGFGTHAGTLGSLPPAVFWFLLTPQAKAASGVEHLPSPPTRPRASPSLFCALPPQSLPPPSASSISRHQCLARRCLAEGRDWQQNNSEWISDYCQLSGCVLLVK